jgi:uncharacterized membrane protein
MKTIFGFLAGFSPKLALANEETAAQAAALFKNSLRFMAAPLAIIVNDWRT